MARRKRVLDDGDSDSSANSDNEEPIWNNDPDAREERALFEDPYQRKRRRKSGKEDAIYGVFADDSEDEGPGQRKGGLGAKRAGTAWTKAPAFVTGDTSAKEQKESSAEELDENPDAAGSSGSDDSEAEEESDGEQSGGNDHDGANSDVEMADPQPADPEVASKGAESEEMEQRRTGIGGRGGIGSKGAQSDSMSAPQPRAGINGGFRSGIGSSRPDTPSETSRTGTPAFVLGDQIPKPKPSLSAKDVSHFSKLKGSFGARMLEKMGWQAGTGLGASGEGIATPIESKLRPQKMGIAFRGFKEKTEQSVAEARRRGEVASDDEETGGRGKGKSRAAKAEKERRQDMWKRPKKVKIKVEHKTYEQILAEAGEQAPAAAGLGQIIDATGAVPREVSSLADISLNTWTPTNDLTRIPEVRHNIRVIADACKSDLDGLAREARALEERKKRAVNEDTRLRKNVEDEAQLIARLQQVQLVANEIDAKAKELSSIYEASLEPFSPLFYKLTSEYSREVERYRLDEIVVAAIGPIVRRMVTEWQPLEEPSAFVSTFRSWKPVLRARDEQPAVTQAVDVYGTKTTAPVTSEDISPMTPFESLLWNIWLPRVRTVLNNDWLPQDPNPAVKLYETWFSVLPQFMRDNILDQLILPKVKRAVDTWKPGKDGNVESPSLKTIVFPWLPHLGLRLDDVMGDAKRKIKSLIRHWNVGDGLPPDLGTWRDVFDAGDWEAVMLKYVVPKLGSTLRDDLRINPRDQKMGPIQALFLWTPFLRSAIIAQLLETEFFPKWLDILYIWLTQPKANFEEVAKWYRFWKEDTFPATVCAIPTVERGFTRGLQLMYTATELGPDAPTRLPRPDYRAEVAAQLNAQKQTSRTGTPKPPALAARTREITFREIVEEFAGQYDLVIMPTGRTHEISRMPLLRASTNGRGGLLIYILDDAVWASTGPGAGTEKEEFRAIPLEDMVSRAKGNE